MRSHAGIAKKMFELLAKESINIQLISTREIKISCVIARKYAELAVRTLHEGFGLLPRNIAIHRYSELTWAAARTARAKSGCDHRKGAMMESVDHALARALSDEDLGRARR